MTIDVRNTDELLLRQAEGEIEAFLDELAASEGVSISAKVLARFEPVEFDERVIAIVEQHAQHQGSTVKRMPSGAGHDAQMFARVCPTGMIFVPSVRGISHNPAEHTDEADLITGTNILLATMLELAGTEFSA